MSEQFLLEDSSGSYFLEDSSGGYRQDFPIKVVNQTIELTETRLPEQSVFLLEAQEGAYYLESGDGYYRQDEPFYHSNETIGIVETQNYVRGLKKEINDIIGLTESKNRLRNQVRNLDEILGITASKNRLRSLIRNFSDTIGFTEADDNVIGLNRNIDEIVGNTESTNRLREQVRNVNETVGIDESSNRDRTFFKNAVTDIIGLFSVASKAEPSLFEFTLEDGSGTLYLEDGTGNYVQEHPVKVFNETVGVTENSNRLMNVFKNISDTIGLTEVSEAYNVIKKVVSSVIGLTETKLTETTTLNLLLEGTNAEHYQLEDGSGGYHLEVAVKVFNETAGIVETAVKNNVLIRHISDTIGLTVLSNHVTGFVKIATSFIVSVESALNKIVTDVNVLSLEDGTGGILQEDEAGFYQLDQLVAIKILNMVNGLTESSQKLHGGLKVITDQLNVVESFNRLRDQIRNFSQTVGITEASNRLGVLKRNFTQAIGITESSERFGLLFRRISSTIGITETKNNALGFAKIINDILQLTDSKNFVSGIVKYISDTVGIVGTAIQFRLIAFEVDAGDFITLSLINLSNFITSTQQDMGDMTRFSAFNSGDMNVDNG